MFLSTQSTECQVIFKNIINSFYLEYFFVSYRNITEYDFNNNYITIKKATAGLFFDFESGNCGHCIHLRNTFICKYVIYVFNF